MTIVRLDPSDSANVAITWSGLGAATISSVAYTAIPGVTLTPQGVNGSVSTVRVSGLVHGRTYQLEATATLSTGETLNRNVPIRAFNG
jgi:hypothetical protein